MIQGVRDALANGHPRVVVEAVPGAGKTRLLRDVARGRRTLILAYNVTLANDISQYLGEASDCVTFHALCGRHIGTARDDTQMEQLLDEVDRGTRPVETPPAYDCVLIDEAQDVRSLYIRLLTTLHLLTSDRVVVVVGDPRQLVYDFDADFPASLEVLQHPGRSVCPGTWVRLVSNETHRLTRSMSSLVNGVFGTSIYTEREGPLVEIRCPTNAFALYDVLQDMDSYLLLVDRRRHNAPLRELLNTLCRRGVSVHVHGTDSHEATDEAVRCATYWSAKGLQFSTVVVLLPGCAPPNPTYVALTRSNQRLVVVLDPRDPHAAVCRHVAAHPSHFSIVGSSARAAVQQGCGLDVERSLLPRPRFESRVANVDAVAPRASIVKTSCTLECVQPPRLQDCTDDAGTHVLVRMALVWTEVRTGGGYCRAMEGIIQPCRMEPSVRDEAIRRGFVGRCISPYQPETGLLSTDLAASSIAAYRSLGVDLTEAWADLFRMACAIVSWDSFEHIMRQSSCPTVDHVARVQWVRECLANSDSFDTLLTATLDDVLCHVRVHATCPERVYHVVWDASSTDVGNAAVRARFHPSRTCWLLEMHHLQITAVHVHADGQLGTALLHER